MSNLPKLTFEQVARPLLAAIMILCYWANNDAAPVGTYPATDNVTYAPNEIRHYTMPCYEQLRAEHPEIPRAEERPAAYVAWHGDPANREARDEYLSAVRECTTGHHARNGKWNLDSMTLVRVER